jgi:hypothetical protein
MTDESTFVWKNISAMYNSHGLAWWGIRVDIDTNKLSSLFFDRILDCFYKDHHHLFAFVKTSNRNIWFSSPELASLSLQATSDFEQPTIFETRYIKSPRQRLLTYLGLSKKRPKKLETRIFAEKRFGIKGSIFFENIKVTNYMPYVDILSSAGYQVKIVTTYEQVCNKPEKVQELLARTIIDAEKTKIQAKNYSSTDKAKLIDI